MQPNSQFLYNQKQLHVVISKQTKYAAKQPILEQPKTAVVISKQTKYAAKQSILVQPKTDQIYNRTANSWTIMESSGYATPDKMAEHRILI